MYSKLPHSEIVHFDLKERSVLEGTSHVHTSFKYHISSLPRPYSRDFFHTNFQKNILDLYTNKKQILRRTYEEMTKKLKIYIYDISTNMKSFKDSKHGVESMFTELLVQSSFVTKDPSKATFFFIPSRCSAYQNSVSDGKRGRKVAGNTMRSVVLYIKQSYPYWDASLGSDHFYICGHNMGSEVARQAHQDLWKNAISLVNTADYQDEHFVPHKDISLPPNLGHPQIILPEVGKGGRDSNPSLRTTLAFFAGTLDRGQLRPAFYKLWSKDTEFKLIDGVLSDDNYKRHLLTSKYCLILRGQKVWSPRLMDAVWFGCVPVIIADYYHLPLQEVVDWNKMAVIIPESKIADVKQILTSISLKELSKKQAALAQNYAFLSWNNPPKPYDAFHMVLYELWNKRHVIKYKQ
ncbi:uncharacterized protein [Ptychodera flava]|uniref:uncharacterized protein isoform X2 n=1 Tax=Ptychodera flava TaxID=63121 RepID=UPI003969E53C